MGCENNYKFRKVRNIDIILLEVLFNPKLMAAHHNKLLAAT